MKFKYEKEVLAAAIIVVLVLALYFTYKPLECGDFDCFQTQMKECAFAKYINEEDEASWGYQITGEKEEKCEIKVTLLNAKEGEFGLREYEGNSMTCSYDLGVLAYPEKDLDSCHGELKENLQKIIINKMYKYIVKNLGEIREELVGV